MDTVDRIENLIVAGSEGFFDEPDIRENLHVTIRIAKDFYDFLVRSAEQPRANEIDCMMGTIRSGMDQFFSLAYLCRVITNSQTWSFDRHIRWDFSGLRETFLRGFGKLAGNPDLTATDGLASLLTLTHLEMVFLAQNFPAALFEALIDD